MEESVLLFIADISGYTKYMVSNRDSNIHAQIIISKLLETIIEELHLPFEVSKLEGDAVFFFYKTDEKIIDKDIGDKILSFYDIFNTKINQLNNSTLCNCSSCKNITKLKLKIVIHYGKALFSKISKFDELSGIDVIIVHRLLKNSIKSNQYIAITEQTKDIINFTCKKDFITITEDDKDIGKIKLGYLNLEKDIIQSKNKPFLVRLIKTKILMIKTFLIRNKIIKIKKEL